MRFGEPVPTDKVKHGKTPILFQLQPEGYVVLETEAEIKEWEEKLKTYYGIDPASLGKVVPLDTCSGGCADDCGRL